MSSLLLLPPRQQPRDIFQRNDTRIRLLFQPLAVISQELYSRISNFRIVQLIPRARWFAGWKPYSAQLPPMVVPELLLMALLCRQRRFAVLLLQPLLNKFL